jgi:manganese/zinc/iron transport system permease protein
LAITFIRNQTRIKEDAAIGIVLSCFFGVGLCLSRVVQSAGLGNSAGLDTFILGKAASMLREDALTIAISTCFVVAGVLLFFKEFRILCFDREFAAVQGWPVVALDIWLMALLVVCTVVGLPAVGAVLMAALLIIPPAAARFWTDRLSTMMALSAVFGLASGVLGSGLSSLYADLSTGPAVVMAAAGVFLVSLVAAPRRGIFASLLRRRRQHRKVGLQNLLRTLYELGEHRASQGDGAEPTQRLFTRQEILQARAWTPLEAERLLARGRRLQLIGQSPDGYRLTPAGLGAALRIVRAHRLWEMFLVECSAIAPDHVDRDADDIEHHLPPELVERLEERLRNEGRLPPAEAVPGSPHPLRGLAG